MDFSKTLQQLEKDDWGDSKGAPTGMVRRCLELRRVPLNKLSADDCRLLLGQKIGAAFVVPVALEFLSENPMEGGDMGPGALLRNVLEQPMTFWQSYPSLWWDVKAIVIEVESFRDGLELLERTIRHFEEMGEP